MCTSPMRDITELMNTYREPTKRVERVFLADVKISEGRF